MRTNALCGIRYSRAISTEDGLLCIIIFTGILYTRRGGTAFEPHLNTMAALHKESKIFDSDKTSISTEPQEISEDDVRHYFSELTCNLRVLGSQLGFEPYELDDLNRQNQTDFRQVLASECFKKEKIKSWQHLVDLLNKPAVNQQAMADQIKQRFLPRQSSMESTTLSRASSIQSPSSSIVSQSSLMELAGNGRR